MFHPWQAQYQQARTDIAEIEKKKRGETNRIEQLEEEIESNLLLLGATAIGT